MVNWVGTDQEACSLLASFGGTGRSFVKSPIVLPSCGLCELQWWLAWQVMRLKPPLVGFKTLCVLRTEHKWDRVGQEQMSLVPTQENLHQILWKQYRMMTYLCLRKALGMFQINSFVSINFIWTTSCYRCGKSLLKSAPSKIQLIVTKP